MSKITVKHFLNKTVKPIFNGKVNTYPIYVQIIAERINYKLKSNFDYWDGYISEADFETDFVKSVLADEKLKIEEVVSSLVENKSKEFLNAKGIRLLSTNLWNALNINFSKFFTDEANKNLLMSAPDIFYNLSFVDIYEIIRFTESEVEYKFSEEYRYANIGMVSLFNIMLYGEHSDLKIREITVFDFLYCSEKRQIISEAVMRYHGFCCGSEEEDNKEYEKVLKELENIIFYKEK